MPNFYDTHAHLDYPDYTGDFPQLVERAQAAGITRMISIGTSLDSSKRAVALAEQYECISAVVGWHPNDAHEAPDDIKTPLRELAKHPRVVAIGETGLDFYRLPGKSGGNAADDERLKQRQADVFRQQLEVAAELGLNCVIHQRDVAGSTECFEAIVQQMEPFAGKVRGVFHCFAGTPAEMQRVLALGSLVSFTGILTFKNGQNIRDTLAATPMGKFMFETDSPFLAPIPYRGKRNEPSYVKEISEAAAQVKNCSLEELSRATCQTAHEFFPKLR